MRVILDIVFSVALGAGVGGVAAPLTRKWLGIAWSVVIGIVGGFLGGAIVHVFNIGDGIFITLLFEAGGACLSLFLAYLLENHLKP